MKRARYVQVPSICSLSLYANPLSRSYSSFETKQQRFASRCGPLHHQRFTIGKIHKRIVKHTYLIYYLQYSREPYGCLSLQRSTMIRNENSTFAACSSYYDSWPPWKSTKLFCIPQHDLKPSVPKTVIGYSQILDRLKIDLCSTDTFRIFTVKSPIKYSSFMNYSLMSIFPNFPAHSAVSRCKSSIIFCEVLWFQKSSKSDRKRVANLLSALLSATVAT